MPIDIDTQQITELMQYAKQTDAALKTATGIQDSIKKLFKRTKPNDNSKDSDEVQSLVLQLMSEVKDAQLANVSLKAQLLEIKNAALDAQNKADIFSRYELFETPTKHFVYRLKSDRTDGEPIHDICPKCKEQGLRSILHGGKYRKNCKECSSVFLFDPTEKRKSMRQVSWELNNRY
jgi:hypothetical protein